ncbi:hypothetical protein [Nocardia mangyaensis]|nr:hypothetical protein [Nocardia mangyaensis]
MNMLTRVMTSLSGLLCAVGLAAAPVVAEPPDSLQVAPVSAGGDVGRAPTQPPHSDADHPRIFPSPTVDGGTPAAPRPRPVCGGVPSAVPADASHNRPQGRTNPAADPELVPRPIPVQITVHDLATAPTAPRGATLEGLSVRSQVGIILRADAKATAKPEAGTVTAAGPGGRAEAGADARTGAVVRARAGRILPPARAADTDAVLAPVREPETDTTAGTGSGAAELSDVLREVLQGLTTAQRVPTPRPHR